MSASKRLEEGGPIAPVPDFTHTGLHERDFFIHGALCSAADAWLQMGNGKFALSEDDIADRVCRIAAAVMVRKERAP